MPMSPSCSRSASSNARPGAGSHGGGVRTIWVLNPQPPLSRLSSAEAPSPRSRLLSNPVETADFSYLLPDEAIAQQPVEPRDAARLLDTRNMTDHTFRDLPELLAPGDLVVVNKTRVRTARLRGTKRQRWRRR